MQAGEQNRVKENQRKSSVNKSDRNSGNRYTKVFPTKQPMSRTMTQTPESFHCSPRKPWAFPRKPSLLDSSGDKSPSIGDYRL